MTINLVSLTPGPDFFDVAGLLDCWIAGCHFGHKHVPAAECRVTGLKCVGPLTEPYGSPR